MNNKVSIHKNFLRRTEGNIAVIFAVTVFVLIFGIAGAIDFTSLFNEKQKAQNGVDAATLASARAIFINDISSADAQSLVDEMLAEDTNNLNMSCNPINVDAQTYTVEINCTGQYKTFFGGILGKNQLDYKIASAA